ncbi:hypothetical protein V8E54_002368 [Elaphomyces granulatus]|jgi:hypothetical protein
MVESEDIISESSGETGEESDEESEEIRVVRRVVRRVVGRMVRRVVRVLGKRASFPLPMIKVRYDFPTKHSQSLLGLFPLCLFILIANVIGSTDGEDDEDELVADLVRWASQSKISRREYTSLRQIIRARDVQVPSLRRYWKR